MSRRSEDVEVPSAVNANAEIRLRICALERANSHLKRIVTLVVAGAALLFFMGQAPPSDTKPANATFAQLTVQSLTIVDDEGHKRIECGMDAGLPSLRFFDEDGVARLRAICNRDWPIFEIADNAGKARLSLGNSPTGPGIMMLSPEGHPRTVLGAGADGPGLVMFDLERPRVLVGVKNNQPVMALLNSDSQLKFQLPTTPAEEPSKEEKP